MLDFIFRNGSPVVRGFCIHGRRERGIDGDRLRNGAELQLDVQCVGLFGNQLQIIENFLLKSIFLDNQIKVSGGKSIEVEDTFIVACSSHRLIGFQICEGKGCAWNHCAR